MLSHPFVKAKCGMSRPRGSSGTHDIIKGEIKMSHSLTFKEKNLQAVKKQKSNASIHTVIGYVITLLILLIFM